MATLIDGVIILLLISSITYGYMVSRKVRLLMATLRNLEPLVEEFSSAVDKSRDSVTQMRESIDVAGQVAQTPPLAAEPAPSALTSRRGAATGPAPDLPGMRVMRDKQDLVRAFFETSNTAKV